MLRSQGDRRFYTEVKEGANLHLDGGHGKSSQGIFLLLLLCGGGVWKNLELVFGKFEESF